MNPFNSARVAKVIRFVPEAHACDLVYLDDLSRAPLVQIMAGVSSDTGHVDLPDPTAPADANAPHRATGDRDVYAVVLPIGGTPLVWGFLPPQVSQLLFRGRPNFRVNRHASDVYETLEDDGSYTKAWPNGTYLKVGATTAKEDLTGKDFDGKWATKRNKTVAPHVHLVVADGSGATKATLDIDPTGAAALTFSTSLDITAPATTIHGPLHVTQDITCDQTVTATTDVVGGGKHLKTHTHSGVQTGSGNTGAPN